MIIPAQPVTDPVTRQDPVNSPSVPDETEVKKEKDALLQNKDYLQIVIEQSPIAIEFYNKEGLLLHVNPACLELFGIKDMHEISKFSLFDDPNISDERKNDLKQGKHIRYEAPFDFNKVKELHLYNSSKSGQLLLDIIITPIKDGDVVTGYLLQIQDITKRKEAEDTLKESNELLSLYVANSPIYTYIKSVTPTEGRVMYASNNFNELIGGPVRNINGKLTSELFPEEFTKKITDDDWKIFSSNEGVTLEENFNGHNYITIKFPIHLKDKDLIAGYTIDITNRKQSEELLKKSNELYSSTISAINDGIWDWDVKTGNAFFSEAYYKMLGYNDKEFPANYTTWKSLVHPDDVERAEKELQEGIVSEKGFTINFRMKMKSGEWLWVSTRGKAIEKDKDGKAVRMVGTLTDISGQMKAEQSLQEKISELEQMNSLMVGRETAMVELKEKIKTLEAAIGQKGAV